VTSVAAEERDEVAFSRSTAMMTRASSGSMTKVCALRQVMRGGRLLMRQSAVSPTLKVFRHGHHEHG
jgi:hypothetical protein